MRTRIKHARPHSYPLRQCFVVAQSTRGDRVTATTRSRGREATSDEYLADAELEQAACICGKEVFEITVGVSLYDNSDDVRWLYLGCRCPACGLTGCYGDWKNEFLDYRKLLARV